jgi:PAS domain S-box-containing protein
MRFLLIDDSPADRELIRYRVRQEFPNVEIIEAATQAAFEVALREGGFQLILCDYALQWGDGLTIVARIQARYPAMPVIMLTDSGNEEVAVQAMKQGLSDYLLKRHLDRLPMAIRETLDRSRLRRENEEMARLLRVSEARYRYVSNMTSDFAFAFRVTPEGETVREWVTEAFYRITGYSEAEVEAAGGWRFMVHPDDEERMLEHHARVLAGESQSIEYRIITRQGARRWLHLACRPEIDPETGQVMRVYGAARDITERKLAEDALRASEARFRAIFNNAMLGIGTVSREGRILDANPAFLEMLGYSREALIGKHFSDFTHPDDVEPNVELFDEMLAGERSAYEMEKRFVRGDGDIIWGRLVVSVVPATGEEGPFQVGMIEDITEQRAALAALIEAEKLALTGTIAASIAHEVNNPMQAVVGCVGLAIEKLEEAARTDNGAPKTALQLLRVANQEMQRAGHIIAQLRDLSRRSWPNAWRAVDLGDLVESVLTLASGEISQSGIEVIKEVEPDLPPVLLVPARIQQVMMNLILNAVAAMPSGGQLLVRVRADPERAGVRVSVSDTGVGIASQDLGRLFQPFYTTKADGVGLGLHLSRNILQEHGGEISVTSSVGEGTTVDVRLPAAETAEKSSEEGK